MLIPFDGIVQAVNVQLGDHVDAGDILMIMDGGDVEFTVARSPSVLSQGGDGSRRA